jgi:hypothetical protein
MVSPIALMRAISTRGREGSRAQVQGGEVVAVCGAEVRVIRDAPGC